MVSVVIPAHNERAVIARLLSGLLDGAAPGEFDLVVVANGCTDDTADIAAAFGPLVRVVLTPVASKSAALRLGDEHARDFPRLYVDADVELGADDVRALARALDSPGVLAAAPERDLVLAGRPRPVRWYYEIWQRLPTVRDGLFGRGVIAVGRIGQERLVAAPAAMSDDLAASLAFAAWERRVVGEARAVIHPPRTSGDLLRRRIRAVTGTEQLADGAADGAAAAGARTSRADLVGIVRSEPAMAPRMLVFLAFTVLARRGARRRIRSGDFTTWLRDDSSRQPPADVVKES